MAWEDLSETEKGYIAGFIDGEGSITISEQNQNGNVYYRPCISIYNTDSEVVKWIGSKLDNVEYSIDTREDSRHNKNCFVLMIRRQEDVYSLIKNLKPYLKIKSEQAEVMEDFLESILTRDENQYSEELLSDLKSIMEDMKSLNR